LIHAHPPQPDCQLRRSRLRRLDIRFFRPSNPKGPALVKYCSFRRGKHLRPPPVHPLGRMLHASLLFMVSGELPFKTEPQSFPLGCGIVDRWTVILGPKTFLQITSPRARSCVLDLLSRSFSFRRSPVGTTGYYPAGKSAREQRSPASDLIGPLSTTVLLRSLLRMIHVVTPSRVGTHRVRSGVCNQLEPQQASRRSRAGVHPEAGVF